MSFLLWFSASVSAQKEANNWYLGTKVGIDFNGTNPVALNDGVLYNHVEGLGTISDKNGNLLFYTNGTEIYNKKHKWMPNGRDLLGENSATQNGLIIPNPANPNLYFVFTAGDTLAPIHYSVVDMSKDNGLGDVVIKNQILLKDGAEKLAAVLHFDQKGVWVASHKWNTNEFYLWLINANGIIEPPVITPIGSIHGPDRTNARGTLKFSPDGKKLVAVVCNTYVKFPYSESDGFVEVFEFNNQTGSIGNPQKITGFEQGFGAYSAEFSPNSKILYVAEHRGPFDNNKGRLFQFPLPIKTGNAVQSGLVLASDELLGTLQCATNGKMYLTGNNIIYAINRPNILGPGCNFEDSKIKFTAGKNEGGLPGYIQSYFMDPITLNASGNCTLSSVAFDFSTTIAQVDSVLWDFGDAESGIDNFSKSLAPTHRYQKAGSYTISLKIYSGSTVKTESMELLIYASPKVDLGNDVTLLYKQTLKLNAQNDNSTYKWSNGATTPTFEVTGPGTYWVEVIGAGGCTSTDTIKVKYDQLIQVTLKADTSICPGQKMVLDLYQEGLSYRWSTGSTLPSISIDKAGTYTVEITNFYQNRTETQTIKVMDQIFNPITNVEDVLLCAPTLLTFSPKGAKGLESYNWYDNDKRKIDTKNGQLTVMGDRDGVYYVSITNSVCESELRRIAIRYNKPKATLNYREKIIDLGESIQLLAGGGTHYQWAPNPYMNNLTLSNPLVKPKDDIDLRVVVFNEDGCTDTAHVSIKVRKNLRLPHSFSPNNDGINDTWTIQNIERYPENKLSIYGRYGNLVRSIVNYQNGWDGRSDNGRDLPVGVYYYILTFPDQKKMSGSITIIR